MCLMLDYSEYKKNCTQFIMRHCIRVLVLLYNKFFSSSVLWSLAQIELVINSHEAMEKNLLVVTSDGSSLRLGPGPCSTYIVPPELDISGRAWARPEVKMGGYPVRGTGF